MTPQRNPPSNAAAPLPGLVILGIGLIATSLWQMAALIDFEHYRYLFQDLPPAVVTCRYSVSWLARIIGLAAGIGILARRELFRNITILLAWATIAATYWKHPYAGFARHLDFLEKQLLWIWPLFRQALDQVGISYPTIIWIAVVLACIQEVVLSLLLIWYFTRPKVKAQFIRTPPHPGR